MLSPELGCGHEAARLARAFEAKYPGIAIRVERSGAERIYQRIDQEQSSRIHAVDVVAPPPPPPQRPAPPSPYFPRLPPPPRARPRPPLTLLARADEVIE